MPRKVIDLTGNHYGRLTVIERGPNAGKETRWVCECECGTRTLVYGLSLKSGATRSCGCLVVESNRARSVTHGMFGTPEWQTWSSMKARCQTPSNRSFKNYGGRGITVCERWQESFDNFIADMGCRPSPDHQLDRIDNDGPYSPDNCRWATAKINMRNRRNTARYGGLTLRELAEKTGENYNTLKTRAFRGLLARDA